MTLQSKVYSWDEVLLILYRIEWPGPDGIYIDTIEI